MRLPTAAQDYEPESLIEWNQTYLVIEAALRVEELKELHVGLRPPEIKVGDLEIAPDCKSATL